MGLLAVINFVRIGVDELWVGLGVIAISMSAEMCRALPVFHSLASWMRYDFIFFMDWQEISIIYANGIHLSAIWDSTRPIN